MSLCVVHLVREQNGLGPVQSFLQSYQDNTGGIPHTLLVLAKGFSNEEAFAEYRERLHGFPHEEMFVPDTGFDIMPYLQAVRQTSHDVYCFVNSFSVLLDPQWLLKLHTCLQRPQVGLVGATGSWGSILSHVQLRLRLRSAYDDILEREASDGSDAPKYGPVLEKFRTAKRRVFGLWHLGKSRRHFDRFPAYHLRTNAFMMRRETMLRLRIGPVRQKFDAYRLESGRHSLTAQVLASGRQVLVVGRDGMGYEKERWSASDTFWQGEQDNLLVEDNQTRAYKNGDPSYRRFCSRFAWGSRARPGSNGEILSSRP